MSADAREDAPTGFASGIFRLVIWLTARPSCRCRPTTRTMYQRALPRGFFGCHQLDRETRLPMSADDTEDVPTGFASGIFRLVICLTARPSCRCRPTTRTMYQRALPRGFFGCHQVDRETVL